MELMNRTTISSYVGVRMRAVRTTVADNKKLTSGFVERS